ncbi:MAG TPA: hypothetical protein VK840_03060 [Candidatus Dormibacteraeota bacterium]|jgi:hypothetical protein|nr:hypothetical protein [Candidatus Dormibacteraeota bacterium]
MTRRYYSSRNKPMSLTLGELYWKLKNLYLMFRDKDFFKEKAGIIQHDIPKAIEHEAAVILNFQPFPITKWSQENITEDHVFDVLEFLYDRVSKPGEMVNKTSDTGFEHWDYEDYDSEAGQKEFRDKANAFLAEYKTGFELSKDGIIQAIGAHGLQHILDAEIVPYDERNVDSKVRNAIAKWRNRDLSLSEKKAAIRELTDVFEWLKKTKNLGAVLDGKDESAIFDLANNFGIRHHNPAQKTNYDPVIWYSWIFHFYLATYHAAIRLLIKKEKRIKLPVRQIQRTR